MPSSQPAVAAAGINKTINFQGRLLSNTGAVVADGNYNMRFVIYQGGTGTASTNGGVGKMWTEEYKNVLSEGVVVKNGYYSVALGTYCAFDGSACSGGQSQTNTPMDWNQDTLWLSMDVDSAGTTPGGVFTYNGELLPMRRMASAVYALQAGSCTSCVLQAPSSTAQNTIAPPTGVVGLTVTQAQTSDGVDIALSNSGTSPNGIVVSRAASGTTTNALNVTNATGTTVNGLAITNSSGTTTSGITLTQSGGTFTTGITFAGTMATGISFGGTNTTDITRTSGTLSVQGTGGVSITAGTTNAVTVDSAGAGSVLVGDVQATTIKIGSTAPTAARTTTVNGGNSIFVDTVNIGTGATTVANGKTVNIGNGTPTGAGTNTVSIGSLSNASTTTIQGGTGAGAIALNTGTNGNIGFTPGGTGDIVATLDADSSLQVTATGINAAINPAVVSATYTGDVTSNATDISVTDNSNASTGTLYALSVNNADNGANTGVADAIARLVNNQATETLPAGLLIQNASGTMTTAIQITNGSTLTNALAVGANTILGGTGIITPFAATGTASYVVGDLLYASSTTALSRLAVGSGAQCLIGGATPTWGSCGGGGLVQVPANSAANTITPTAASTVGLTVNGTSNVVTGATALVVNQASTVGGPFDAEDIDVTNGSSTVGNGLAVTMSGAGTLTNGITVSRTAGTLTNGLDFAGTMTTGILFGGSNTTDITRTSGVLSLQGTGGITLTAPTGTTISVDTAASGGTVSLGAANATSVNLGNTGATTTGIQGGTAINIGAGTTAGTVSIGGASTAGTITVGKSTVTNTISIGSAVTGATFTQRVDIANGAGAGTATNVNILSGVGTAGTASLLMADNPRVTAIDLGNVANAAARITTISGGNTPTGVSDTINIGTGSTVGTGTKVIHIGDGLPAGTNSVTIGSIAATANTTTIQGGNGAGAVSIQSAASGTISVATANAANTVQIGNTVNAVAQTIGIGNNNTAASANTVVLGSLIGTSTTTVQGGTGNINLNTNSASAGVSVKTSTNSVTAFRVLNSSSNAVLTVDTSANKVSIGKGSVGESAGVAAMRLVLDNSDTAPTEVNGGMYYDTGTDSFRCGQNGYWAGCTGIVNSQTGQTGWNDGLGNSAAYHTLAGGTNNSYTIPAGDCQTGVVYHITAAGTINDQATWKLKLYLFAGATRVAGPEGNLGGGTDTGIAGSANYQNYGWYVQATMTCYDASTVFINGTFTIPDGAGGSVTAALTSSYSGGTGLAWSGGSSNTLSLASWWNSNAPGSGLNTIKMNQFVVERMAP